MSDENVININNRLANKSTTTTIAFPILLLERITEISREWAVSLGFSPNGNRNRWIIGVLKRAIDEGTNPLVEVSREDLAKSIHLSSKKVVGFWSKWEDEEIPVRESYRIMADELLSQVNVYKKEKGE